MNYILKNTRVSLQTNEYIIFNSSKQVKAKIELRPKQAEQVRQVFSLTPVSPMQMRQMKLNEFKEIEI